MSGHKFRVTSAGVVSFLSTCSAAWVRLHVDGQLKEQGWKLPEEQEDERGQRIRDLSKQVTMVMGRGVQATERNWVHWEVWIKGSENTVGSPYLRPSEIEELLQLELLRGVSYKDKSRCEGAAPL